MKEEKPFGGSRSRAHQEADGGELERSRSPGGDDLLMEFVRALGVWPEGKQQWQPGWR